MTINDIKDNLKPNQWVIPLEAVYTSDMTHPDPKQWIDCYDVYGLIQYVEQTSYMIENDIPAHYIVGINIRGVIDWRGQDSASRSRQKYSSMDKAIEGLKKHISEQTVNGYNIEIRTGDIQYHVKNYDTISKQIKQKNQISN